VHCVVRDGEYLRGENGGITRAGPADGHAGNRNAGRHLHRAQGGVDAVQRPGVDRNADYRQGGLGRQNARQRGAHPRRGDNQLKPAPGRRRRILMRDVGRAMSGDNPHLVRDAELL